MSPTRGVAVAIAPLCLALMAACSIHHRSDEFACQRSSDCSRDRTCVDGFCVLADDVADAAVCPPGCTSCNPDQKRCTIDCAVSGDCGSAVSCPRGWSCDILCTTPNACRNGVDCTESASCTITCSGFRSCQTVNCGTGRCTVACTGGNSCRAVECDASCACDVTCQLGALCDAVACPASCTSSSPSGGCSSQTAGCDTCP